MSPIRRTRNGKRSTFLSGSRARLSTSLIDKIARGREWGVGNRETTLPTFPNPQSNVQARPRARNHCSRRRETERSQPGLSRVQLPRFPAALVRRVHFQFGNVAARDGAELDLEETDERSVLSRLQRFFGHLADPDLHADRRSPGRPLRSPPHSDYIAMVAI